MRNATYIGCKKLHSGCKSCIDKFYKDESKKCPICSKPINKDDVKDDDARGSSVLLLEINCPKCNNWTGRLATHDKHLQKECGKKHIQDTGFRVQVKTLEGRVFFVDNMHASDSILSLQQKIKDEGIDIDEQRYVKCKNKHLQDLFLYVH